MLYFIQEACCGEAKTILYSHKISSHSMIAFKLKQRIQSKAKEIHTMNFKKTQRKD